VAAFDGTALDEPTLDGLALDDPTSEDAALDGISATTRYCSAAAAGRNRKCPISELALQTDRNDSAKGFVATPPGAEITALIGVN
jgi:hypothetical protein